MSSEKTIYTLLEPPAHSHDWSWLDDPLAGDRIFAETVTLDPEAVLRAWNRLTQDTWVLEFQEFPRTMHAALLHTLRERGGMKHGR